MAEIDRSLIGTWSEPFVVDVEKGAIRKFAEAIGDPNPLYFDERFARQHGYPGLLAPPTFPISFRPPFEPSWSIALDRRRILAGEMRFRYVRSIVAGMRIECRLHFTGVDEKQGRKGTMELLRQEMVGNEVGGAPLFTHFRTTVYRSLEQVKRQSLA